MNSLPHLWVDMTYLMYIFLLCRIQLFNKKKKILVSVFLLYEIDRHSQ